MNPTFTISNLFDGFGGNIAQASQPRCRNAFIQQCFDSTNLRDGQLRIPHLFASQLRSIFVSIFSILFWRTFVEMIRITTKTITARVQDPLKRPFAKCKTQSNAVSKKDLARNAYFPISRSIDVSLRFPTFCVIIQNGYLFLKSYPQFFFGRLIRTTSQAALITRRAQHQSLIIYGAITRACGAFHINSITQEMAN